MADQRFVIAQLQNQLDEAQSRLKQASAHIRNLEAHVSSLERVNTFARFVAAERSADRTKDPATCIQRAESMMESINKHFETKAEEARARAAEAEKAEEGDDAPKTSAPDNTVEFLEADTNDE